jgi:hypothetical protein
MVIRWSVVAPCLLAVSTLWFLYPFVFLGHVATPTTYAESFGSDRGASSGIVEDKHLADVTSSNIPELEYHISERHRGVIATWAPNVQLGRPIYHFEGYSKANPIVQVLSLAIDDPFVLHTATSTVLIVISVCLSYWLAIALGLHPVAGLALAIGLGLNTRSAYWFGFAQFLAWPIWSVGIMLFALLGSRGRAFGAWLALAFCTYCFVIGSRSQAVIRSVYFLLPFFVWLFWSVPDLRTRGKLLAYFGSAAVVAAAASTPVLSALYDAVSNSTRFASDTSSWILDRGREPSLIYAWLWNAGMFQGRPLFDAGPNSAIHLSPFFMALVGIAAVNTRVLKRTVPFWIAAAIFTGMTLSAGLHEFAVDYMGMGFSRGNPLGGLYVPVFLLAAYALDDLLRHTQRVWWLELAAVGVTVALGISSARRLGIQHLGGFALGLFLAMLAASMVVIRAGRPAIASIAAMAYLLFMLPNALHHRPRSDLVQDTPFLASLRGLLGDGRLAKFGSAAPVVVSNQEVLASIRSIHSYDSVSSRRYNELLGTLSPTRASTFGRRFDAVDDPNIDPDALSYTGVSVVLSDTLLPLIGWEVQPLGRWVAHTRRAQQYATLRTSEPVGGIGENLLGRDVSRTADLADYKRFQIAEGPACVLFVSEQYHSDWHASIDGRPAVVIPIRDFYIGVETAPGAHTVELSFEPFSRFAWVPNVVFLILWSTWGLIVAKRWWQRKRAALTLRANVAMRISTNPDDVIDQETLSRR